MEKATQENIQNIINQTRVVHNEFNELIKPYRLDLWKYCKYITGSPWDGEDLFQETLLKAFTSLTQLWNTVNLKSYLFRIATNTWIDFKRKKTVEQEDLDISQNQYFDEKELPKFKVRESLEILLIYLSPKQASIFLLMDVFNFRASDVACMTNISENSVYTSLHRSRKKLKEEIDTIPIYKQNSTQVKNINPIIDEYLKAFNSGNVEKILSLMSDQILNDASPGFKEQGKDEAKNGSLKFGLPGHLGKRIFLWGKEVNIVLAETKFGYKLHDINYQILSDDKIVVHKSYFFCRELLTEASKVLDIPIQLNKPPLNWEEN
ncbi:RNA polymerase sigma factor [Bacillus sp. SM2101]|uniref:RNA polymerase sigma factor n=1 Tax=Bacillus sp. SM2101 TaxID=2805366 RepID=UPI001BDF0728